MSIENTVSSDFYLHSSIAKSVFDLGAQWLSGRVLDPRPRVSGFEPHRRHCVVVLEQDTFILAQYWFNQGRPVPVSLKDC